MVKTRSEHICKVVAIIPVESKFREQNDFFRYKKDLDMIVTLIDWDSRLWLAS